MTLAAPPKALFVDDRLVSDRCLLLVLKMLARIGTGMEWGSVESCALIRTVGLRPGRLWRYMRKMADLSSTSLQRKRRLFAD